MRIRRGAREERRGGTGREDERHVARRTRLDAGDGRRVRAAPNRAGRREGKGLIGGARRGFLFFFFFFPGL